MHTLKYDFIWDDFVNLPDNENFQGFTSSSLYWMISAFHCGHYHPLTWFSFAIDYSLWGMNPRGYRLTNIILHSLNALLFYFFIQKILKFSFGAFHHFFYVIAAIGTLFFSIHPLRVESVVWITERRDVLCVFFYLLTLHAYLKMQETKHYKFWYILSLIFFMLSLLSKAWGITLPVLLLLLDIYPLRKTQGLFQQLPLKKALLLEKIPYFFLSFCIALTAILAQKEIGALHTFEEHPFMDRLAQAAYGVSFYFSKTLFPFDLSNHYSPFLIQTWAIVLLFLCQFILFGFFLYFWQKKPYLLLSYLSYIIILSPVLGFTQSGVQFVADRYTYLACFPLILLLCGALHCLFLKFTRYSYIFIFVAVIFLSLYTLKTISYTKIWRNNVTLWWNAYEIENDNLLAMENLNVALNSAKLYKEAKQICLMILEKDVENYQATVGLAIALVGLKDEEHAFPLWKKIQSREYISPGRPASLNEKIRSTVHIGLYYKKHKQYSLAIEEFLRILTMDPKHADAYNFLGEIYEAKEDIPQAILHWQKAIALFPQHTIAKENLARILEKK